MKLKGILMLCVVLLFSTVGGTGVFAAEKGATRQMESESLEKVESHKEMSQETINIADRYITIQNQNFVINNIDELKSKLSENELRLVEESVELMNKSLNNNESDISNVNNSEKTISVIKSVNNLQAFARASSKEGKNGFKAHWWGAEVWLSKSTMKKLTQASASGAVAIITLATGLVGGLAAIFVKSLWYDGLPVSAFYTKVLWVGYTLESGSQ